MGIPDHLTFFLRNLYSGRKQQLELDMEQQTGSKLGKEYNGTPKSLLMVTAAMKLKDAYSLEEKL